MTNPTTHDVSYADSHGFTCPQCGDPFSAEIWLIVDASARPDLLERIRAGDLHTVACPTCGPLGAVDAPLLIYRPDAEPTVLFSSAQQTSAEQDQQQALGLVERLRASLGDGWQEQWISHGISGVQRAMLAAALSDDPEAALRQMQRETEEAARSTQRHQDAEGAEEDESGDEDNLPDVINRFLAAETWDESQRIVERHPELLSDETDTRFAQALEEYADNPNGAAFFSEHRTLLRRCREVGIGRAFAEKMLPPEALAQAEQMGLTPEEFLAMQRAAQQMPPALREVLAELAASGIEIRSQEDLDRDLTDRPDLQERLRQAMAQVQDDTGQEQSDAQREFDRIIHIQQQAASHPGQLPMVARLWQTFLAAVGHSGSNLLDRWCQGESGEYLSKSMPSHRGRHLGDPGSSDLRRPVEAFHARKASSAVGNHAAQSGQPVLSSLRAERG